MFADLMHTDPMSELYQRKVSKARSAIENAATARSIVRHLKQYDGMKHQLAHLPSDPGTIPFICWVKTLKKGTINLINITQLSPPNYHFPSSLLKFPLCS
uniref:Uncharacterized protein n=1 Tax=Caenorhabditis japonica TaxID=281687 RepID=A0A8R1ENV3_CAEJA